jgi:hypothetical protein
LYRGIKEFKKGYQPWLKYDNGNLLADPHSDLNGRNFF